MKITSILRHAFCAVFVTAAALTAAPVFAVSPNIVISQVYGGGGNGGATLRNDYVELFNRSTTSVSVAGWSVQYAATGGSTWSTTPLTGTIPAGGYFLVQMASGGAVGALLPTPDVTGVTNMSATAGKVALVNVATLITGGTVCPTGATIVDFVGYGPATTCSETTPTTPNISATLAAFRAAGGCTDTDSNVADFANATPNARNSATATNSCSSLPNLTIDSVTTNEGNSGITTFTFTVTLSAAAPTGGVTFDIATANNTATSGSDYTAKTLTAQIIPAGSTSYTFTVDVQGDVTPEVAETFFVNVTNAVNANITTGQGTGTITNDDAAANLTINDVTLAEGNSGTTTFAFTVSLSAPAPSGGVTFDIATADGTATAGSDYVAQNLTGQIIPAGSSTYTFNVTVNGDTTGELAEAFFVNITNVVSAIPLDAQGLGTISNDDATPIHTVQGSGNQSPLAGTVVTVEGIVTADFQGANQLSGFYIQTPDAEADADVTTSQGIFVYTNLVPYTVALGDRVRVSATVIEFGTAPNTLTELTTPTITTLSNSNALPVAIDVALPIAAIGDLERYEGMRVSFTQSLTVSDHFDLAHFGEVTLTANGRALQPTNEVDLNDAVASGTTSSGNSNGAAVTAFNNLNIRSSILLDDASTVTYPPVVPFVNPTDNTLRLGSAASNLTGILSQAFGAHRLYATVAPVFAYAPRPATPPVVGGNVKVASANVLNYFNGDGLGGGFPTARGADSPTEFARQRAKTIAALNGLGADVIGLIELENDGVGPQSAIQDLINGLNAATAPGTWNFVADPANYASVPGGTDAIRPIFIYKAAVVAPVGLATTISDSAFVIARAPVAQTFRLLANNEQFVAVVNHFKAKSSGGATGLDIDQNDGQANFNATRKLQSTALLGFINTLAATTPRVITFGDFNAYEQEDPMDVLRAGGLSTIINNSYSYMFNGLSGSLDHALGNAAMMTTISGSGKWHINADEPVYLDYNVETKNATGCVITGSDKCSTPDYFAATPFRASDHDPVLVGLNLIAAQTITFPAITSFSWSGGSATVAATASSGLAVIYSVVSGPCAIVGTTVTATGGGTCVIAADQAGNASYNAAPQVTQSVTVTAAAQTITFPAIAPFLTTGSATLAATASSGLVVTYSVTSGPCSVSVNGTGSTLTATAAGTCVVAADQIGGANYSAAAQVSQSVIVTAPAVAQTITFPAITSFSWSGGSAVLAATASSGLAVTYAVASGPCVITGTTLTATGAGTCSVSADQAGNAGFTAAAQVTQSVTVTAAAQTITFPAIAPFVSNASTTLAATASSGLAVTYSVISGPCSVSGNTVTATAGGTCVIAANQAGNINYSAAAQASQSVTVTAAAVAQTITFPAITSFIWSGGSATLAATASSGLAVSYSVASGPCAITGTTLTANGAGTCSVSASQAGNASFNAAASVTNSVTILQAPQTITFPALVNQAVTPSPISVFSGTTNSGLAITLISLTPTVCEIANVILPPVPGNIRAINLLTIGTCTLRASQSGDANFLPATPVDQSFQITAATGTAQTIDFPPIANQVGVPRSILIDGGRASSGLQVTRTSLTPSVCETFLAILGTPPPGTPPNTTGVRLLANGTCILRASQAGDATFAAAPNVDRSFTISAGAQSELTLAPDIINPRAGTPITITALVRGVTPNGTVTFTTTPVTTITAPTVTIQGCANLSVSSLPADSNSAVATCVTLAEPGARRVTATYSNDNVNVVNPAAITTNSPLIGPLDYSDIWWAGPSESGWGMTIAQKGTQQFNAFYVYDNSGKPVWYVMGNGAWNQDYTKFTGSIYQPTGSLFSNYDPHLWQIGAALGTATLTFTDANNAVFDYTLNGVTAKKNITRFVYGAQDAAPKITVKDIWWAGEAENGWGVSIAQQDRSLFAAWYTYGADGKATWFVMSGGTWAGTVYTGTLYTTTSSPWLGVPYNAAQFRTQSVGTVSFDFRDQDNAKMTYTVNGVTQTKSISRFAF
jgi:predicted extracellular nuclease